MGNTRALLDRRLRQLGFALSGGWHRGVDCLASIELFTQEFLYANALFGFNFGKLFVFFLL